MNKTIAIPDYLTEEKLINFFIGAGFNLKTQFKIVGHTFRYDILLIDHNILIEFDGDQHFRDSLVIKRDDTKNILAHNASFTLIRIPYFIQLREDTKKYLFGELLDNILIEAQYKHGFIDSKIFPASYCELGRIRFEHILNDPKIPLNVLREINDSLEVAAEKYGDIYVK